jgi:hypothetical protein
MSIGVDDRHHRTEPEPLATVRLGGTDANGGVPRVASVGAGRHLPTRMARLWMPAHPPLPQLAA